MKGDFSGGKANQNGQGNKRNGGGGKCSQIILGEIGEVKANWDECQQDKGKSVGFVHHANPIMPNSLKNLLGCFFEY